jgi:hypothetical protein
MSNLTAESLSRQSNINEWYYNYRLDTLFVLQLVFLGISLILLMTILSKYKIVSPLFVMYAAAVIVILLFLVWYFKYTFNKNTRDFYHWDKRNFSGDGKLDSAITPEVQAAMTQILATGCGT